jgi:hypothetical protein
LNPSEQHVGCEGCRHGGCGHGSQEKARGIDHGRPQDWKKVQGVEAIAILINHEMVEIAKANAKREGQVDPNNLKEQVGNGCLKKRVNLDGPDGRAGNGRPEMRSTKVPTKRGHSFSIKTVNKDVSREE